MSIQPKHATDPLFGLTYQFQPILAADGKRLLAYETLVRRAKQDGTIDGPSVLIPRLLRPELIESFTRLTLEFAFARLEADPYLPALSVNLSPCQIELPITRTVIAGAPMTSRRRLMIELTEDSIANHPGLPTVLDGLAALGIRVLLDDIAPGSLQRFASLRGALYGLKLDRSLLPALAASVMDGEAAVMLDTAIASGLVLVAEGVEDTDVLPRLASRGISFFQGFALGEPWPDPRIARRHILPPRNGAVVPEPELMSVTRTVGSSKHN